MRKLWPTLFFCAGCTAAIAAQSADEESNAAQPSARPLVQYDGKRLVLAAEFLPPDAECLVIIEGDKRTSGVRTSRGIEFPLRWGMPRSFTVAATASGECAQRQKKQDMACVQNAIRYLKAGDAMVRFDSERDTKPVCNDYAIRRADR